MKSVIILLLFPLFSYAQNEVNELVLIENYPVKQLVREKSTANRRFDLSGIVLHKQKIYVISDKEWNKFLYEIDTLRNNFHFINKIPIKVNGRLDCEGVDVYNDKIIIVDEWHSEVYSIDNESGQTKKNKIYLNKTKEDFENWGNAGFEGIAGNMDKKVIYLAKERNPAKIFEVDMKKKEINEAFTDLLMKLQITDISDIKYENGAIYILNRKKCLLFKIDTETGKSTIFSFKSSLNPNGERAYSARNLSYGMAEALLLTPTQIWIGLDNNGDKVSEYGKSLGLNEGSEPCFFIFKRPIGF